MLTVGKRNTVLMLWRSLMSRPRNKKIILARNRRFLIQITKIWRIIKEMLRVMRTIISHPERKSMSFGAVISFYELLQYSFFWYVSFCEPSWFLDWLCDHFLFEDPFLSLSCKLYKKIESTDSLGSICRVTLIMYALCSCFLYQLCCFVVRSMIILFLVFTVLFKRNKPIFLCQGCMLRWIFDCFFFFILFQVF